jgi:phosphorylase/glycogen(starch) synthase
MILSDLDRLDRILNHPSRPVHIVFSGKAHPNDEMGKDMIKKVISVCKDKRFRGKIFFVEGYDIRIARHLVQGVDVWLNTPRRPLEASGTSGEKVVANGVLNLSISDGWWVEGYDGTNGWTIGPVVKGYAEETANADEEDSQSLYALLENSVIPLYYDREMSGLPQKWIAMIKRSMQTLIPRFNTDRMLIDYYRDLYLPTARREHGSWPTGSGSSPCASPHCDFSRSESRGPGATRFLSSGHWMFPSGSIRGSWNRKSSLWS